MKTTIYRYSNEDTARIVGCYPSYGLDDKLYCNDFECCCPMEVELPEGWTVTECNDSLHRPVNPQGYVCSLETAGDCELWIWPEGNHGERLTVEVKYNPDWVYGGEESAYFASIVKRDLV